MQKSGSGGWSGAAASPRVQCSSRSQTTSPSRLQGWLQLAWRRSSADRGFARSLHKRPAGPCSAQQTCSRYLYVRSAPNRTKCVGAFGFAEMQRSESPAELLCTRCRRLVPTRCYGSERRFLPHPASLARGRLARNQPTDHRQTHAFHHTQTQNGQHYVLTNSRVRPMMRRRPRQRRRMEVLVV